MHIGTLLFPTHTKSLPNQHTRSANPLSNNSTPAQKIPSERIFSHSAAMELEIDRFKAETRSQNCRNEIKFGNFGCKIGDVRW